MHINPTLSSEIDPAFQDILRRRSPCSHLLPEREIVGFSLRSTPVLEGNKLILQVIKVVLVMYRNRSLKIILSLLLSVNSYQSPEMPP